MRRGVLFKNDRISLEWTAIHAPLRDRLLSLADMVNREMGKPFTITCLCRTPEENTKAGGNPKSLHMANPVRAADIRTTTWVGGKPTPLFSGDEVFRILGHFRLGGKGFGGQEEKDHIHLQVKG